MKFLLLLFFNLFCCTAFAETFALMADLHFSAHPLGAQTGQINLINSILNTNPKLDAILLAGDSTSRGADIKDWDVYNGTMSKIPANIPILSAIGNHETYDYSATTNNQMKPGYVKGFANFKKQFGLNSLYYSRDFGNTHFVFLEIIDTNWNMVTTRDGTSGQYNWLVSDLNSSAAQNAKYIVVITHMPLAPNNAFGNFLWSDGAYKSWAKIASLVTDKKVNLFIGGHTHTFKKYTYNNMWFMMAGGPGAEGYIRLTTTDVNMKIEKFHAGKLINTTIISPRK